MQESRIWDQPAVEYPERVLTPITSKEPSAKFTLEYNPQAGFTCEKCPNRIYDPEPDYMRSGMLVSQRTGELKTYSLHLPARCARCDGIYTRYKRMQRRTTKIWKHCKNLGLHEWRYEYPKLITFNLDSGASENAHPETEMKLLKKKMRQAKVILKDKLGVLGGTYVLESTSKIYGIRNGEDWVKDQAFMAFSHHAHCHMVGVAPYINADKLPMTEHILEEIGLGTINYKCVTKRKEVSSYITKYLTKGKTRSVTWGIMRKTSDKPPAAPTGEA